MKKSHPVSLPPVRPTEPAGFVPLNTLKGRSVDAPTALSEIRRIYFNTTRQTIANDLAHAIDLLKALETEEQREKASVYMEGLAQMRSDWERKRVRKRTPTNRADK
jgi:hypothetical protein